MFACALYSHPQTLILSTDSFCSPTLEQQFTVTAVTVVKMADLKPAEVEKAKLHFDIYDFDGSGKVDAVNLGSLIRSLDLRPTNAAVDKAGATKKKGI